ncbi:MAG: sulfatase [Planctomycetota bacterium]
MKLRFLLVLALVPSASNVFGAETPLPNILVTLADDCTYWDLACYGGQAKTPNLDRLCSQGMRLDRCFQAAPMCSPTRHCLYTGLYPVRSGAYPNHTKVYPGVRSIAHHLKDAGYRVALSGKTHINPPEAFPFEYSMKKSKGTNPDFQAMNALMSECAASATPMALFMCSNEPHTPYTHGDPSAYPPESLKLPPFFVDTPETRKVYSRYLAEVTYYDSQVGRALRLLKKHGLADNTLVIVLTEQGNGFPFAKWTCYEMGLASGMIVRWPGRVAPGSQSDALVEYVDVVPTLLDIAGIAGEADSGINGGSLDGMSFAGVLTGETDRHKSHVFGLQTSRGIHNGPECFGIRSVRSDRYRYIRNLTPGGMFQNYVVRRDVWKSWRAVAETGDDHAKELVYRYQHRPAEELFDCQADPHNLTNLADDPRLADVKSELRAQLDAWMASQGDEGQATEMKARERQTRKIKKAVGSRQ